MTDPRDLPPAESTAPSEDPPAAAEPTPGESRPGAPARPEIVPRTRTGALWVMLGAVVALLVLLIVFIVQNDQDVDIEFLGFNGTVTLGLAMLIAAVIGAGLTVIAGTARIIQLRMVARRNRAMHPRT